jgi:hypothetical protein
MDFQLPEQGLVELVLAAGGQRVVHVAIAQGFLHEPAVPRENQISVLSGSSFDVFETIAGPPV